MKNNTKKKILYVSIFLVIIVFLQTFNTTISRYAGGVKAEENDVVAIPILTLDNDKKTYTITNMLPGDVEEYIFTVANFESNPAKINEVLLDYYLTINFETEIPLTYEIYEISGTNESKVTVDKTNSVRVGYSNEESKTYKLKIIWNSKDNSYEYAGKPITCNVVLIAEQVVN